MMNTDFGQKSVIPLNKRRSTDSIRVVSRTSIAKEIVGGANELLTNNVELDSGARMTEKQDVTVDVLEFEHT